jgi:hypothetical protein
MEVIVGWIDEGIQAATRDDEDAIERLAARVRELAVAFPIPGVPD